MAFAQIKDFWLKLAKKIRFSPSFLALKVIFVYQKVFSLDHSFWGKTLHPQGFCRFYPSCSEYWRLAIIKHGFFKGSYRGIKRLLHCHPFSKGGVDEA